MAEGYKTGGLQPRKYIIEKADGTPIDPNAQYFVLRVDKDPHALAALKAYADSVVVDNPEFAADLKLWWGGLKIHPEGR